MTDKLSLPDLVAALTDSAVHWQTMKVYLDIFLPHKITKVEETKGLLFLYGKLSVLSMTDKGVQTKTEQSVIELSELLNIRYKGETVWMNEAHRDQCQAELSMALPTFKFTNDAEKRAEQEQERAFAMSIRLEKANYWVSYALQQVFLRQLGARIADVKAVFEKTHIEYCILHPQPKKVVEKKVAEKPVQLGMEML